MKRAGYVARMGDVRNSYKCLTGTPEGKRPLRRLGRRWEEKVKVAVEEKWWESVNYFQRAENVVTGGFL
jgi:hypothetical protein